MDFKGLLRFYLVVYVIGDSSLGYLLNLRIHVTHGWKLNEVRAK